MIETVTVPLGARAYDIRIGPGLVRSAGIEIARLVRRPKVAVVTETRVAALHLDALRQGLEAGGIGASVLELPPGEATKGWKSLERTVEWLIGERIGRDDLVLALGGGVTGDLAGFAAAVLRRGVGFVQVPTTLLAQVDSSVGGKTGINSPQGKNLVGAFHQPRAVLIDTGVLDDLPGRELRAGYAEVAKYGLIRDAAFFAWLEEHGTALLAGDPAARAHAIRRSLEIKAEIVAEDERETKGLRALLNLGHTFGHALEAATGYGERLLHGEGVAIGMAMAFRFSQLHYQFFAQSAVRHGNLCKTAAFKRRLHQAAIPRF